MDYRYGLRLAIIYAIIWFIDLLDASLLNVALPEVSASFGILPTHAEWALIGFLLAMTLGMVVSQPSAANFGSRRTYLASQWLYVASSLACGLSTTFSELVFYRVVQGFAGGLAIPLGMALIISVMPKEKWAKTGAWINLFSLIAPALGPVLAGYITTSLNWRWLFFVKIPISLFCLFFSYLWVRKEKTLREGRFDWFGFFFAAGFLTFLLLGLSGVGKELFSQPLLLLLFTLSLLCLLAFFWQEKRFSHPLMPIKIFNYPLFAWGNVVQSAANMIFLGATFLIALYLQQGLGFSIVKTGWIMAAITLGMGAVMPLTARYYNRLGPVPFMIPGLLLMAFSMFALLFVTHTTPPWIIALIIFFEGAGSAGLQSTNFVSIFSEIPQSLKGSASSLYAIFKQLSASFGIALSTMALALAMKGESLHADTFRAPFILLGVIPLVALLCCLRIDNNRALKKLASTDHLEKEFEEQTE